MRRITGMTQAPRPGERGFALLVVMLLAAAVAFSLYTQVPRVAFEGMREKEQLLMDRGNQYKRAIQVFYAVNKRFPARIEDLENTGDKRFLRRRYKDPMTGKDEWRLIHTNGSFLTDSLVQKPPALNAANGTPGAGPLPGGGPLGTNNMNTLPGQANAVGTAGADSTATQPVALNPAALRRPSDRVPPGNLASEGGANPVQGNGAPGFFTPNYDPNNPSTWPPITLAPANPQTGQPVQPGQPVIPGFGGQNVPGQQPPTQFNPQPFGAQPAQPGQPPVTIPGFGGQNVPGQQPTTQIVAQPFPTQSGQPSFPGQPPVTIPGFGGQNAPGQQQTPLPFGPQQGNDPSVVLPPFQGQPNGTPSQAPPGIPGQSPGAGGVNPQPTNIFNPGLGFAGNPLAPDQAQQPTGLVPQNQPGIPAANQPGQPNPQLNAALQAINAQLTRPTGPAAPAAPGGNPQAALGIAGVASTFEGTSIKIYREHSKYKEWEFVFDPANGGAAGQQIPGANGQNPAVPGQMPGGIPLQPGSPGPAGGLFGPTPNPPGQTPNPTAPANPFAPTQSPFGQAPNPFAPAPN